MIAQVVLIGVTLEDVQQIYPEATEETPKSPFDGSDLYTCVLIGGENLDPDAIQAQFPDATIKGTLTVMGDA